MYGIPKINATIKNDQAYVVIDGDLEMFMLKQVRARFNQLFIKNSFKEIHIDLGKTNYIDSSGIAFLIEFKKVQARLNKFVKIDRTTPSVYNIFKIAGLLDFFEIPPQNQT